MSTITTTQQQAIAKLLATMTLPTGRGTRESACSIAAINLALTGELTDRIPECMSAVIGRWIIGVQDAMPSEMRNSAEWKRLLPLAAGTGRNCETERMEIVLDWMWRTVLPTLQPIADRNGFGEQWRIMLNKKTHFAADTAASFAASDAASDAAFATFYAPSDAASFAASDAASATFYAAKAAYAASFAASYAAYHAASYAASYAASAASFAAKATSPDAWQQFNPCGLLERLYELEGQGDG